MSIMNVILLSTTPLAGLGALLGMCRFEKWALDDHPSERAAADPLDAAAANPKGANAPAMEPLQTQPLQAA